MVPLVTLEEAKDDKSNPMSEHFQAGGIGALEDEWEQLLDIYAMDLQEAKETANGDVHFRSHPCMPP
jgi:hypothetical protein